MAAYRFGDPRQLEPTVTVTKASEVVPTSKISVLSIMMNQRCEYNFLSVRYRIYGELPEFPSNVWYEGRPVNSQVTVLDNELKTAIGRTNLKHYGIRGPNGQGSLLIIVDVVHGQALLVECGTSLQNHANADSIMDNLRKLIAEGFPKQLITVISLYKGQKGIVTPKFVEGSNGNTWLKEVLTVDAYQGKQNELAFFDMVAGGDIHHGYGPALADGFPRSSVCSQQSSGPAFTSLTPSGFASV